MDIGEEDRRVPALEIDLVRDHGRPLARGERGRLEDRVAGQVVELHEVVVDVGEPETPGAPLRRLARDEEVLLVERPRVEEARPDVVDEPVHDLGLHGLAVTWDPLHYAVGLEAPLRRVEEHELAHARHPVVAGDDADDLGGVIGDRPRVENRVRPVGVAAVVLHLPRAVGVHREQQPREVVRRVGVLPARVEDAAVVHDGRAPVVVLVEAELADLAGRAVEQVEVRDLVRAGDAGDALEDARRVEEDSPVGQVARVVVVDIGVDARGDLCELLRPRVQLEDLPALVAAEHREEEALAVEVEVDVGDLARLLWLPESLELRLAR